MSTCDGLCTCVVSDVGTLRMSSGSHAATPFGTSFVLPLLNAARNESAPVAISDTLGDVATALETPLAIETVCAEKGPVQSAVLKMLNVTVLPDGMTDGGGSVTVAVSWIRSPTCAVLTDTPVVV